MTHCERLPAHKKVVLIGFRALRWPPQSCTLCHHKAARGALNLPPTLTGAPAQVFDVDLLLLHTRRLSDQTGVVVGVPVGGTHRVLVVPAAVDVTYAPGEGAQCQENECFCLCSVNQERVSASAALISSESLAEAHFRDVQMKTRLINLPPADCLHMNRYSS